MKLANAAKYIMMGLIFHSIRKENSDLCIPFTQYCKKSAVSRQFSVFIAPAYSRVRYRSSNFRPSVRSSIRSFVRQHLRRSLVFSTSEIAASLKPCIVIVPDTPSSTHLNPVPLTYISRSTDFENFYVKVWFSQHQR